MEKTRAVAYIRVSTERDAQLHSYEFQEHYWQSAFEDDPNTDLIGIYADKGISGHSVQKRPKFLVMMQDAREHKFDKIYTKSVSRFARNTTQLLEAVRELRDLVRRIISPEHRVAVCILFPCAEHKAVLFAVGHRQYGISEGGKLSVIRDIGSFHLRCVFVESDIFPHRRDLILNICNFTAVFIG